MEKGLERISFDKSLEKPEQVDFSQFEELVKESRKGIKLTHQACKNNQPAENYLLYRDPKPMCDKYLDECIIEVTKPITPAEREKIAL